jgi:hypothetical protein
MMKTNMHLDITCTINLPSGMNVEMTPKELLKFHDDLTKFINDNYEALNKDED